MAGDPDGARRTLAAFADRAAAIMRTAAAQREDLATVGSTMNILVRVGQREHRIERTHLPEPELIQAAVMLRPVVFLQKDPVQIGKVLNAVGLLLLDAPQPVRDYLRDVQRQVNKLLKAERWVVMVGGPGAPEPTRLTDVEIAELWFDAHVWHNDMDKQWALKHISEDECLISASVWVGHRILLVRAVQQLIADLRQAGHLSG
ncbi:hypothetical protein E9549_04085 [Blastococcus sp. MG754426]|uniref:hypothetical protein n=1 Tax=unclassified Blastococcus TaxID=2619396 RepID=UPI001EF02AC2|nr:MULTISPECIES: hypothetical protein [unclassified Blastococcus]MCF6506591.1 hypothetical protein [Blastococcus sp. MG754426]MCF6510301.1 hypothetical protein [Blastococcus sp. MG754427]